MTPKQADTIIKHGKPVTVHNAEYNETFTKTFIRRDRWSIYSDDGGVYDRKELELAYNVCKTKSAK